ncbi:MAG: 8-oxoguanine deaminase, partial [Anaerolinea sp.]|nr:8-oxoguanine deaminase [Anaerolinea sp.]
MSQTMLLRRIHTLVTMDGARREIRDAAMFIRDGVIVAVGRDGDLPPFQADLTFDLPQHIILPGLVNTHHHMFQSLTRAFAQDRELFGWLRTLYPIWARL